MICAYIDAYRDRFGVEPICRVFSEHSMKIAPQTYYAWRQMPLSKEALEEARGEVDVARLRVLLALSRP